LCRTPCAIPEGEVTSLIKDYHKIALVELALKCENRTSSKECCSACSEEATLWCQEDECSFCATHAEDAHKYGKSRYHTLVHPSKKIIKVYCPQHKKESEKFCQQCETIICMDCFIFDHIGHKISTVESVFEDRKMKLHTEWTILESELVKKLSEEQTQLDKFITEVSDNLRSTRETITEYFDNAIELLHKRRKELLSQVEEKESQQVELATRRKQLQDALTEIRMQTQVLNSWDQNLSPVQWMEAEKATRQNMTKWNQPRQPLNVKLLEISLPRLQTLITATLQEKLALQTTQTQLSLVGLPEVYGNANDVPGRGYEIIPEQDIQLCWVLVQVQASDKCFVVLADRTGQQIEKQFLKKHDEHNWYHALFNNTQLIANNTYHIFCVRPKGEPIYYCDGNFEARTAHPFCFRSMSAKTAATPFQPIQSSCSIQMTVGWCHKKE